MNYNIQSDILKNKKIKLISQRKKIDDEIKIIENKQYELYIKYVIPTINEIECSVCSDIIDTRNNDNSDDFNEMLKSNRTRYCDNCF